MYVRGRGEKWKKKGEPIRLVSQGVYVTTTRTTTTISSLGTLTRRKSQKEREKKTQFYMWSLVAAR